MALTKRPDAHRTSARDTPSEESAYCVRSAWRHRNASARGGLRPQNRKTVQAKIRRGMRMSTARDGPIAGLSQPLLDPECVQPCSRTGRVAFAVPGDLATPTGG